MPKKEKNLAVIAIDKINKYLSLGFVKELGLRKSLDVSYRNPLIAKEYIKEKLDQQEDIGEPTPFEPIDSVAKKVADGLGTGFDATIGKLVEMFYEQQTKRRKTEKGREEDIFEAEVLEND